jgi:ketol-acid reductoisomerase
LPSSSASGKARASWDKAVADGFVPGETLLPIEEAAKKATVIQYLLSDAGQVAMWPKIKACLNEGDALYFSHGFGIVYKDQTGIVPPENVDVILAAPKGSGTTVRTNFLDGSGINSSFAVHQDFTGRAKERTLALGIAIGSGYLFPTTFEKEVHSDLTGERGVLMGCLAGVMEAQYNLLRKNGHSPSEAFNETVEELTQSLIRLVAQNGMDWMFANCSTTAQRGALDWAPRFRDAVAPVFEQLYESVTPVKRPAGPWNATAPRITGKNWMRNSRSSMIRRCGGPVPPYAPCDRKTGANKRFVDRKATYPVHAAAAVSGENHGTDPNLRHHLERWHPGRKRHLLRPMKN